MKLLSRLFGKSPAPPPAPAVPAPVAATPPPAPPPPAVDPAEHEQQLRAIAAGSVEPAELARLAVDGPTTRVRQAAAAAIVDPALWDELLPRLRGKDKAAYKLVRQRADERLAGQRQAEQAASEAAATCASLERLANRPHDAAYAVSLSLLAARWQALPAIADEAVRERGAQALGRCHEVVATHERELARVAAERAAEAARARELEAERQALRQAAAEQAATQAAAEAGAQAAAEADAEEARATAAEAREDRRAALLQAHGEIASLIRLGAAALHRGDTRKAARFRQSIEAALPTTPPLPPQLARGLEQLDARLNELRQWKDYVAAPKRIELIEEVEALVGVDEAPEALAEHLRALRQEWRTLNKGVETDASAEFERFEQAYQAAFKPCQAYFAEQAAIRRANLDARRQVLERVLAFEAGLDAEQPDHPLISRVLREAPQEWRSHGPVDRDAGRPVEAEFHRALDRLRARVTAWYTGNAAEKTALIARARQLATLDDAARAVDEVKRLQAQWKASGPVPHAQSPSRWEEFRALCDGVFERRQQAFAQASAALERSKSQAIALCEQLEQAALSPPADRATGQAQLPAWHEAFDSIGELPYADSRGLRERFQRAIGQYEALLAGQDQRESEGAESNLREAARLVRAWQRAVIEGAPARGRPPPPPPPPRRTAPRGGDLHRRRVALARQGRGTGVAAGDGAHRRRRLCGERGGGRGRARAGAARAVRARGDLQFQPDARGGFGAAPRPGDATAAPGPGPGAPGRGSRLGRDAAGVARPRRHRAGRARRTRAAVPAVRREAPPAGPARPAARGARRPRS
jgi:hypothetical protein